MSSEWISTLTREDNLFLAIVRKALEDYIYLPTEIIKAGVKVPCQDWHTAQAFILGHHKVPFIYVHPDTGQTLSVEEGEEFLSIAEMSVEEIVDLAGLTEEQWYRLCQKAITKRKDSRNEQSEILPAEGE